MPDLPVSRLAHGEAFQDGIVPHRSSGTWVTRKTPQERFCGVVFSHGAVNRGRLDKEGGEGVDGHGKRDAAGMAVASHG